MNEKTKINSRKYVTLIIDIVGDRSASAGDLCRGETIVPVCLCVFACPVTDVLWGEAVRVQDTQYVADDVSILSL